MITRRIFLERSAKLGMAGATMSLWRGAAGARAFAQMAAPSYKAIVLVTMTGGNDGNNMLIPLDSADYAEYASIRGGVTLSASSCLPLHSASGSATYGLHPSMTNIAALYNAKKACFVANVGPLAHPATKAQLLSNALPSPDALLSHPAGVAEWESAGTSASPLTGWGGRIADLLAGQSGKLSPLLSAGTPSIFPVGSTVQAINIQGSNSFAATALPPALDAAILKIALADSTSSNKLVAQVAQLRVAAMQEQSIIDQAASYKVLSTKFPHTGFGSSMSKIAQIIAGNSVLGASRQIFYAQQGAYDTHTNQLALQAANLQDLDSTLGAFFNALDEIGMTDQVLVCTHSDFNRTLAPNVNAGTDHAWGNHQIILGGGIAGGRIYGTMPTLELGGSDDLNGLGVWVPTTAVTQMAAGVGSWMGLTAQQLSSVFPDLANFSAEALSFV